MIPRLFKWEKYFVTAAGRQTDGQTDVIVEIAMKIFMNVSVLNQY